MSVADSRSERARAWNGARLLSAVDAEVALGIARAASVDALSHTGPVA
jgi:hypothetical protein